MEKILFTIIGMLLTLITVAHADPTNLALTGTATQSSTYPRSQWSNHNAGIAIDGITDGNAYQGHITHTLQQYQAWWQVDLLGMFDLDQIVLWNRTDCCGDRLSNFNVSVLDNNGNTTWENDFFTSGGIQIQV